MMLVIRTQFRENYGAHDWDGTGACPQYWKNKGGSEYKVLGVPLTIDHSAVVSMANIERSNDYVQEYIVDWSVESDDYLSAFEKGQLEYDGEVVYAEPTVDYRELMEMA
jgi:hypothetical protein